MTADSTPLREGDALRARTDRDASDAPDLARPRCQVWGVLNVTPDSFSDGGDHATFADAIARAEAMWAAGADVIDVGGESTRPAGATYGGGYETVSVGEEVARVVPVVEAIVARGMRVSVDTTKAEVARRAVDVGAAIVNDVSMGADPALVRVAASSHVELVLMHNRGRGEVRGAAIQYRDVVREVREELLAAAARAQVQGVARERIWLDPGVGFAKTAAQSAELVARTDAFVGLGHPVLVGASRKSFLAALAPRSDGSAPPPRERVFGTAAAVTTSVLAGARAVRVHDVRDMRQVVDVANALAAHSALATRAAAPSLAIDGGGGD